MRVTVRKQVSVGELCTCALRVKATTGQLSAAWDAAVRLKDADLALQFILGADSDFEQVRSDCGLIVSDLRENLGRAERAARRHEFDDAGGLILGTEALLSNRLIHCMTKREELPV